MQVHHKDNKPTKFSLVQTWEDDIQLYTHQYERPHNTVLVPCDKLAEMQAELARLTKENHDLWEQLNDK